ncbi:hypothetical protein [Natrinema sp. DC36]|uniref:hypothetical protein n=1 Tax=Natrinema sp. DC36 TaxID=2878680 RepID=UPI001CEFF66C|nr:hypothetical protein [Natrinema sp. DC36]
MASIDSMEPSNGAIATRLVDSFKNVLEENYVEEGKRVRVYKDIAAEDIEPALNQIDWNGTAVEVAGRLASNLILKHALPTANHRTAIGMCQLYLRRVNPGFRCQRRRHSSRRPTSTIGWSGSTTISTSQSWKAIFRVAFRQATVLMCSKGV